MQTPSGRYRLNQAFYSAKCANVSRKGSTHSSLLNKTHARKFRRLPQPLQSGQGRRHGHVKCTIPSGGTPRFHRSRGREALGACSFANCLIFRPWLPEQRIIGGGANRWILPNAIAAAPSNQFVFFAGFAWPLRRSGDRAIGLKIC